LRKNEIWVVHSGGWCNGASHNSLQISSHNARKFFMQVLPIANRIYIIKLKEIKEEERYKE